ncbi:MAG: BamA/TamA family outer membrane protein [Anaeromyxobacter sp.]|nr:BamA/TamA family outer membrane protein [Anaeromyxobacter sp.]MBL0277264.1 BamA/TamA family outer membrane protein [Anaeromyxobacter sp.]
MRPLAAALAALLLAAAPGRPGAIEPAAVGGAPPPGAALPATPAPGEGAAGADPDPGSAGAGDPAEDESAAGAAPTAIPARAYLVERVRFTGLGRVEEWAARRHLVVQEGQTLDEQRVLVSRLRLLQLGWFTAVETRLERGSARGQVVLVFEVVERNTLLVSELALGSTAPQPLYGALGLTQQNFLGEGLSLGGAFAYGGAPSGRPSDPARFALRGAFYAPDVGLLGHRFVAGVNALWLRGEELACPDAACDAYHGRIGQAPRLRYQRAGGEVLAGLRPGPFERITAGWRYEQLSATELPGVAGPAGPPPFLLPGRSDLSALTLAWEYDDRDDLFLPREGLFSLAQLTFSSRLFGSDYEYSRYALQLESGFNLLGRPLRLQAFLGATQGEAPFFERFFPADLSYFAVGPALGRALELNFSSDSRYDAFAAMGGLEYAVPLWSRGRFFRRGYLALGARAVWSSATLGGQRTPFSRWPVSLDAALRLDTPIGTFNASLGAAIDNLL